MNRDRDLTILLTLKDRTAYTLRWMAYAEQIKLPFKVLIADGGADENIARILADRSRYPGVDYEYIRFPYDASYTQYYAKIAAALDRVTTAYVVMADNDDFFFADALRSCVDFLAAHPGYVACGGQCAIFWLDPPPSAGDEDRGYGRGVQWKYPGRVQSIEDDSAGERVLTRAASTVDSFYYDVKRTGEAKRQFGAVCELDLADLFLVEHLVCYLTAIAGKTRHLPLLYLARQHNSPERSGSAHQDVFGDWMGRMLLETWSEDFAKFLDAVASRVSAADRIPVPQARELVIRSYRMLVAPALLSDLLDEPTVGAATPSIAATVRRLVRLPVDSVFRRLCRWLYRRIRWISQDVALGTGFLAQPAPDAEMQFRPVRDFLIRRPQVMSIREDARSDLQRDA